MITVDGNWIMEGLQTYIVIRSFRRKKNKKNEEYGWAVADYTLSENLYARITSAAHIICRHKKPGRRL